MLRPYAAKRSESGGGGPGVGPFWIPVSAGTTEPFSRQRLTDLVRPIPDQLDLQLEVDARILPDTPACFEQQLRHVRGAGPAVVEEEIGVHSADLRLSDSHSFQPRRLHQPAGEIAGRVLEHRTPAGAGRLGLLARFDVRLDAGSGPGRG